ncbi:4'-phosphopantetheinyl transferase family protein [Actimicrobium antarcticum]|uniref:4'-phosphopantetheinyl transferase superfamily protein n=1 Tax=Actimicrobium antarcticum TaxID=1051899 RepID=A0ABP7TTB0_9BURK
MKLAVTAWPAPLVVPASGLVVLRVCTPSGDDRTNARRLIRAALLDALGQLVPVPATLVQLPAKGLHVAGSDVGLSVSHASGLSVCAINLHGAVGIDLMRLDDGEPCLPDWDIVARDYLGPAATRRIATVAVARRALCFAQEWTQREAQLKLQGRGLTEWIAVQDHPCTTLGLDLPEGFVGAVSLPRD